MGLFRVRSGVLESQSVALSGRTGNPRGGEGCFVEKKIGD